MNKFFKSIVALSVCTGALSFQASAATYRVIDSGSVDSLRYTYSQKFNVSGDMALSGTGLYNFPVQFQYLDDTDFANIALKAGREHTLVEGINDIEDLEALQAGNPTANDIYWVIDYLKDSGADTNQRVGDTVAMTNFGNGSQEFLVWDEIFEDGRLTRSTVDFIKGITDNGWVYGSGSAPYLATPYITNDGEEITYFIRGFSNRAYFSPDGGTTVVPIVPPSETELPETQRFGGISTLLGMSSNNMFAVGSASFDVNESTLEIIESTEDNGCADPDVLAVIPKELCVQRLEDFLYSTEPVKWSIDNDNNYVVESLGTLITPHPDDTRVFVSQALDVNDSGVAVGRSPDWIDENVTEPSSNQSVSVYAVIFKDGEVLSITEDRDKYFGSVLYDIANNGMAVGHATTIVNGAQRTKAFFVDTTVDNPVMTVPDSYFLGASSTARAINNNGSFVGEGEVETHNDDANNPRRREAYVYNIEQELLYNLNALTECNSPYTIVEARDINDDNVIAATALVKQDRRDAKGEVMLDENGNTLREDVVRSIVLEPIPGGEIEECPTEDVKVVRKGASFGFFTMIGAIGLAVLRRTRNLRIVKS